MFIHTNQLLITSFLYKNFLRNGRVRGKRIGRVRVKFFEEMVINVLVENG